MKRLIAATAILAALFAAGCGDDDDEPATTDDAGLSEDAPEGRAEFIADADEICTEAAESQAQELENAYPNVDPEQLNDKQVQDIVRNILAPSLEDQLKQIEKLPVPEGDEEEVEEVTTALGESITELENDPVAIRTGGDSLPALVEAAQLAQEYGFQQCGGGGDG